MFYDFFVKKSKLSEQQKTVLREKTKKLPNGYYAEKVCIGCGEFECGPDGDVENCSFVKKCKNCVKTEFEVIL